MNRLVAINAEPLLVSHIDFGVFLYMYFASHPTDGANESRIALNPGQRALPGVGCSISTAPPPSPPIRSIFLFARHCVCQGEERERRVCVSFGELLHLISIIERAKGNPEVSHTTEAVSPKTLSTRCAIFLFFYNLLIFIRFGSRCGVGLPAAQRGPGLLSQMRCGADSEGLEWKLALKCYAASAAAGWGRR